MIGLLEFLWLQMLPTVAYADNPSTSFAAKFVHASTNKNKCSINCVLVSTVVKQMHTDVDVHMRTVTRVCMHSMHVHVMLYSMLHLVMHEQVNFQTRSFLVACSPLACLFLSVIVGLLHVDYSVWMKARTQLSLESLESV